MGTNRLLRNRRPSARKPSTPIVEPLDPRRLLSATPAGTYPFGKSPATLTDADGTAATFSLPTGQGAVTVSPDGSWHVSVSQSTPSSTLTITSTNAGDARISLAELTSSKPLGTLNASKATLTGATSLSNVKSITLGTATDLSLTSSSPLTSLTATSWTDSGALPNDALTAPSISSLTVKGNFAPAVTLTSAKTLLKSATIGGTVTGAWSVAGPVGTLKLHAVRSPDLSINGTIKQLSLDDYVALTQVPSSTGGVLHLAGKGSVSAAKGRDNFQIAKNTTLYTCTADTYTWSDLYQYTNLGRKWTYTKNRKTDTEQVLPSTQKSAGHDLFVIQETGPDAGTESYFMDSDGRGHLSQLFVSPVTYHFTDLTISPTVYQLGATTHSSSHASGSGSEDGISVSIGGTANFATRFAGHQLVKTPAGTFLAAKLVSSLNGSFAGAMSNGSQSINVNVTLAGTTTEYAVPGLGIVQYDTNESFKATAMGQTETDHSGSHVVLTKLPIDTQ